MLRPIICKGQNICNRPIICKGKIYAKTYNMQGQNMCKDLYYARGKYMQKPIICKGKIYTKPIICNGKI